MTIERKRAFITNCVFFGCIVAIGYLGMKYLLVWMLPFVIGFAVAAALQKPIRELAKATRLEKRLLSTIVTFLAVSVAGTLFASGVYNAAHELGELLGRLPAWYQTAAPAVDRAFDRLLERVVFALPAELEGQIRAAAAGLAQNIQSGLVRFSSTAVAWAAGKASSLPSVLIAVIITVVATFFMSVEFEGIKRFCKLQIPERYRRQASESWDAFGKTLVGMLSSYLLIMFITFVELSVGLILLKVNYAVLLAAIISLVDILPVLGTGTVLIPWGVVAILMGDTGFGAGILAVYFAITIVRNILEPKIIGNRIGLHPLVTLMFMYLGLHALGLPGMFLFPLALILVKNLQDSGTVRIWKSEEPGKKG